MQETQETLVWYLGQEHHLEECQPTPVFLPGKFCGQAIVHGVTNSQIQLSMHSHHLNISWQINTWLLCYSAIKSHVQFRSVVQSRLTLCDPMDCSMPGLPVHHQLLEFTQSHVHWVGDAIQPSHHLSSPSPPTFKPSQPSGSFPISQFFTSGGQSIGVSASASVLPKNIQGWFPLGWTGLIALQSKRL